jgi:hypothetical protein
VAPAPKTPTDCHVTESDARSDKELLASSNYTPDQEHNQNG